MDMDTEQQTNTRTDVDRVMDKFEGSMDDAFQQINSIDTGFTW